MSKKHNKKFRGCFPTPPAQPAVGDSPQVYLEKLNTLCRPALAWPKAHPKGQLTRTQLRKLCRDTKVDVLIAYAAVMAWGGRGVNSPNYRLSLSGPSRTALIAILKQLRASPQTRQADFYAMQRAAENIKGLGISFYTKLLFFFREKDDSYILDQFTAKSAKLLFDPCQIVLNSSGYPDPDNTPASYEWFCASAEAMGGGRTPPPTWTGEQVEQAMFDVRGGVWRKYIRSIYGSATKKRVREPKVAPQSSVLPPACHRLAAMIAKTHASAYKTGSELPGAHPRAGVSSPVRVHCSIRDGVSWQYAVQKDGIHAQVFIPKQQRSRYDSLRTFLGVSDHDFGDGIVGTGFKNGKTCSLKLTVHRGTNAPESEWGSLAKESVSAMNRLFTRVCENI